MTLLPRLCLILALTGLVSGCQPGQTGPAVDDVTPNAVTGDAIEVTALDATPLPSTPVPSEGVATASALDTAPQDQPGAGVGADMPAPVAAADDAVPAEAVEAEAGQAEAGQAEAGQAEPAEVAPPPPPKSERQIACERKRGSWEESGGGFGICIVPTRDSGKHCTRESQCENVCLARSQTCAPVTPLLGCHEILQDDGSRATQCID